MIVIEINCHLNSKQKELHSTKLNTEHKKNFKNTIFEKKLRKYTRNYNWNPTYFIQRINLETTHDSHESLHAHTLNQFYLP